MSRIGIALLLVLALAMSIGALAEVSGSDILVVSFDRCFSGNDYTLLLTKQGANATALNDSDILYIDQLTAEGSSVMAAIVYPDFTTCDAFVGGTFSDGASSPRSLGRFIGSRTPNQLALIEESAFENSAFTHVFLSEQVTAIGARAFANCDALRYICIPDSVTEIADDAFVGCDNVVIGCYGGEALAFANRMGLNYKLLGA